MVTTFPPSCATFMAVEHIIHLQSVIPSPAVLAQSFYIIIFFFSFLEKHLENTHTHYLSHLLKAPYICWGQSIRNVTTDTYICSTTCCLFFFFFLSSSTEIFFFPPLTFSWNDTFPRGRFSSVAVCGCLSCWNTEISFYMLLYTALLEPLHLSASCSCFTVIFHLLFGY